MPKARPTSHRRWLLKMAREADRERLRRARAALKQARELKRSSRQRARETCQAARVAVREWAKLERVRVREDVARLRLEAKTAIAQRREHARTTCSTGRLEVQSLDSQVKGARATLVSEREQARLQRIWSGKGKAPTGAARTREVRQESDDEVRGNLSGDELYVWERVKSKIKPRERMSRLEAFQHWMHEHGGEVSRILEQQYAGDVARLEREEKAAREAMRPKSYAKASDDDLTERVAVITSLPPPPKLPTMPPARPARALSIVPSAPASYARYVPNGFYLADYPESPQPKPDLTRARNFETRVAHMASGHLLTFCPRRNYGEYTLNFGTRKAVRFRVETRKDGQVYVVPVNRPLGGEPIGRVKSTRPTDAARKARDIARKWIAEDTSAKKHPERLKLPAPRPPAHWKEVRLRLKLSRLTKAFEHEGEGTRFYWLPGSRTGSYVIDGDLFYRLETIGDTIHVFTKRDPAWSAVVGPFESITIEKAIANTHAAVMAHVNAQTRHSVAVPF